MATRVASICVAGLKTTAKWVDHLIVECYTDPGYQQLVSTKTSSVVWDGTYNKQHDPIFFTGLVSGQTYYFRAGVVSPINGSITWSTYAQMAGDTSVPEPEYTFSVQTVGGGAHVYVTPNASSIPANIDHYEATWVYGYNPLSTDAPKWSGHLTPGSGSFEFIVSGEIAKKWSVWVRAVNTSHSPQAWVYLTDVVCSQADPSQGGIAAVGSIPPTVSGNMLYTSDTGAIAWYWDGEGNAQVGYSQIITIYRADGTNVQVPPSKVGTNGLASGTVYYFYPYYKEVSVGGPGVGFVGGGVGSNDSRFNTTGGAGIAQTSRSLQSTAVQSLQGFVPLAAGGAAAQTASSGTGGSYGGGSGGGYTGGGGCPRRGMKVITKDRGIELVENLKIGDQILSRNKEWVTVVSYMAVKEGCFVRINTSNGDYVEQSAETDMPLARGYKRTKDLSIADILNVLEDDEERYAQIRSLEVIDEEDLKFGITCEPNHEFYCGANASILTHNMIATK